MNIEKFICCDHTENGWSCFVDTGNAIIHVKTENGETQCFGMPSMDTYLRHDPYFLMSCSKVVPAGMQKAVRVILNNDLKYKVCWIGGEMQVKSDYFRFKEMQMEDE